ncbi:MAG: lactonase family protein [Anaerolineae bacterium]
MTNQVIYIGTYTQQTGNPPHRPESIYCFNLDEATGELTLRETIKDVINPSFLTFSADRLRLFTVNETSEFAGVSGGGVSSLRRVDDASPFSPINSQPTHGGAPCYVRLSEREKWLLVANYLGGVTALPIDDDGGLGAAKTIYLDESGKYTSHPHCAVFDPSGRYLFVADLGRDQVLIFAWNNETGALIEHSHVDTVKGAGPRHIEFHRNGRFVYVTNELDSTLGAYSFDASQGTLTHIQTVSTLPADWAGEKSARICGFQRVRSLPVQFQSRT